MANKHLDADETDWSHIFCQKCIGVRPAWSLGTKQDRWSRWASKGARGRITLLFLDKLRSNARPDFCRRRTSTEAVFKCSQSESVWRPLRMTSRNRRL